MTDDLIIIYNNFDFQKSIKHQLVDDHKAMRSVITDKFIHNIDISSEELKQLIFHEHIFLHLHDLLESSNLYQNNIINYILIYFIFKAIKDYYSSAVSCIFKSDKHLLSKMSQLDILSSWITKHCNMSSILFNKNITNNIYEVTDTIFQHQLKLNKNMYFNRLFLMYDDQKTAQLLQDIKKKQWETDNNYNRCDYILSVLILFHLCMNLLYLI